MIRINLLPVRAAQKRAKFQREIIVFCMFLLLAIAGCAAMYFNLKIKIAAEREIIAASNSEIIKLKSVLGEVAEFKKKQAEYQGKLDVLANLKRKKSGPIHLLDDLNKVLPDKLWLESFKESDDLIEIKGIGISEKIVASFITGLESSPYYKNVDLKVIRQIEQDGKKLQSFEIGCRSEYPQVDDANDKGSKI